MTIDCHVHFWNYSASEFTWISDAMPVLKHDFLPADIAPLLTESNVDGILAVQSRQTMAETKWLLELAETNNFIKGVVGWVDLTSLNVTDTLDTLKIKTKLRGIRHLIQDEPNTNFMLNPAFISGVNLLHPYNLVYELLVLPHQYATTLEFVKSISNTKLILDHLGKPDIKNHDFDTWSKFIAEIALHQNVYCKLSGLLTQAEHSHWHAQDFEPYLDFAFKAFGTNRLMLGSDWPVCLLSGTYAQSVGVITKYIAKLSQFEQTNVLFQNAHDFYTIN